MKTCKVCNTSKELSKFARNAKSKDGYLKTCKSCVVANKKTGYSLRQAINDKCKDCIYDPYSGGGSWREQVKNCTSGNCPLYVVRPMPSGG